MHEYLPPRFRKYWQTSTVQCSRQMLLHGKRLPIIKRMLKNSRMAVDPTVAALYERRFSGISEIPAVINRPYSSVCLLRAIFSSLLIFLTASDGCCDRQ